MKNFLVTGTSRGLGREFVEQLLRNPEHRVFAVSMNANKLAPLQAKHGDRLTVIAAKVSDESSRAVLARALEGVALDVLVNNAGAYPPEPDRFEEIPVAMLQHGFETNVYTSFRVTQACLPALRRAERPIVAHVSSLMGSIADNTSGGSYAYRMAKAALNMFNKCFSIEHPEFVSIVLHPGWVKTDMGGENAPTLPKDSIAGMLRVLAALKETDTGKFFDFEGDEIPW